MKKQLITLAEHDALIQASVHDWMMNEPRPNGIACKCGHELLDCNPNMLLTVLPPRKSVRCPKCGWQGSRLA